MVSPSIFNGRKKSNSLQILPVVEWEKRVNAPPIVKNWAQIKNHPKNKNRPREFPRGVPKIRTALVSHKQVLAKAREQHKRIVFLRK